MIDKALRIAVLAVLCAAGPAAAQPAGFLRVSGERIVDGQGRGSPTWSARGTPNGSTNSGGATT